MPDDQLRPLNYEQRILETVRRIRAGDSQITALLKCYKYVLVDECQDLVGLRADLTFEILRATTPGFTLFCDSAQAIYDFQIRKADCVSKTTSRQLLEKIKTAFPDVKSDISFRQNFRAEGNTALLDVAERGRLLLLNSPNEAHQFLKEFYTRVSEKGSLLHPNLSPELHNEGTCVVCRFNSQVIQLAAALNKNKPRIPFAIVRSRNEYSVPSWVGRLFLEWNSATISRNQFLETAPKVLSITPEASSGLWDELCCAIGVKKPFITLKLVDLRAAIAELVVIPDIPREKPPVSSVLLSTIHRAKGREYSNVVVVIGNESSGPASDEDRLDPESESRVLFVGLTRAKKNVHSMDGQTDSLRMCAGRCVKTMGGQFGSLLNSIQVGIDGDINPSGFAAGEIASVRARQHSFATQTDEGTPAELRYQMRLNGSPIYSIQIAGKTIGIMSENFGWSLYNCIKTVQKRDTVRKVPHRILNLWVRQIVTELGDTGNSEVNSSFRSSGLWLGVRIEGLGTCTDWKEI